MELLKCAEIYAAVIGIMLTILYYSIKKSDQAVEWRIFLHFQMHGILFVVMSLFVELIEKNAHLIYLYPMLPRIMRSLKIIFFQMILFFEWLLIRYKDFNDSKTLYARFIAAAPCLLVMALAALSIPFDIFYRYTEDGVQIRGLLGNACYMEILLYIGCLIVMLIYRQTRSLGTGRRRYRIHMNYLLGLGVGIYVEYRYFHIESLLILMAINLFILYITLITRQISTDSLTHINNRQHLIQHIAFKMANSRKPLYLIMADIDFFKRINDKYGHVIGDETLIRVANSMKAAVAEIKGHPFLARYGGDEFIICMESNDASAPSRLMEEILRELNERNANARHAKELSISIGMAQYKTTMKHPRDFIQAVDKALYKVKQQNHEKHEHFENKFS